MALSLLSAARTAEAQFANERLCDNQFEDCRAPILKLIADEKVGIDVSFWFMTDHRYRDALVAAKNRGVAIRVLADLRADTNYPANKSIRDTLVAAGIPIRTKVTAGINHWKMMLYAGQSIVHFTAANFANGSYSPDGIPPQPYVKYVDEAVYFTDDPDVVHTFMTKYDDLWTNITHFANFANINGPLVRNYPTYPLHSSLNFPPDNDYFDRLIPRLRAETERIDVIMFRITSGKAPDELLSRHAAGVPIRLITDKDQYRNTTYFWDSYNVDRMYAAGIPVKWRRDDAQTDEDMHQKSVNLYSQDMVVFGSSNWTASSSDSQREHNYFTTKGWFFDWFRDQFERRWNNRKSDGTTPLDLPMYLDFVPAYPEAPVISAPANGALGVGNSVTLRWEGGWWAHKYDIYFGTTNPPPLIAQDFMPGSATAGVQNTKESFNPCAPPTGFVSACPEGLAPGTTYYWKIRGKTMAALGVTSNSNVAWSFTTAGTGSAIPPTPTGLTGSAVSSSRIDLSWTDVAGEDGYKIERKLSSSSTWTQIATRAAGLTTYQDQSGLVADNSYNYRVRAYTSAGDSGYSNTVTVSTPAIALSATDVVLYASEASVRVGAWSPVADSTAAGGSRISNPNAGAALISAPSATPANYFEMSFQAPAGQGFRLWIRGKATSDNGNNDSAHVQFSDSVTSGGSAVYRIGTTAGTYVNLAEASGAALQGWGWQDNGFGTGVFGPLIYFANSGTHTIRVQVREDGFSIDQIVLSRDTFVNVAPGANKGDNTKLPEQNGTGGGTAPASTRILADAYVRGGTFAATNFGSATELISKMSSTDANYERWAYLKLDIGDIQPGDTVSLRLSAYLSDTRAASVTATIYAVSNTSWTGSGITWNNKPALGTPLGNVVVSGTSPQWYTVDLTSYVQSQRQGGASTIAIAIKNPSDTLPYSGFSSSESGRKPELVIE